jgi:hypothetical protein
MDRGSGVSQATATILLIAITILLAAFVLLLFHLPSFESYTPAFIEIDNVYHNNEHGSLTYDSRVVLFHNGTVRIENDSLNASFFRNGTLVPCIISTMNGHNFISTHHFGVQTMGGMGCSGIFWEPHARIAIDFSDGTFHPGDTIRVDIYSKTTNRLISRYSYIA